MITDFSGVYHFLSNFFERPVCYKGIYYASSECAYQADKFDDPTMKLKIAVMKPNESKKYARANKSKTRPTFHDEKVGVMKEIVLEKFKQNPDLATLLLGTGTEELVEGNWWNDIFWGVCKGRGENPPAERKPFSLFFKALKMFLFGM